MTVEVTFKVENGKTCIYYQAHVEKGTTGFEAMKEANIPFTSKDYGGALGVYI
jgi:hypothetical protein